MSANPADMAGTGRGGRSLVVIEQGFLKPRRGKPVHGVELFRMHLVRQLAALGVDVTVVAERSWGDRLSERCGPAVHQILVPAVAGVAGAGLMGAMAAVRASRRRGRGFDVVMFGNAGDGMVPAMLWSAWNGLAARSLVFAHREPGEFLLGATSELAYDVVANSSWIAGFYRGRVPGGVSVMYGLANAEWFVPRERAKPEGAPIELGLIAKLPSVSKGLDTALAAYRALPEGLRSRCRLHLAGFADPPSFDDPSIVAHRWMAPEAVPSFVRELDILLCVSIHETFSQAIVQGMLSAVPIVATELDVYTEKLDPARGGGGGIIARGVGEIVAAIERLAGDGALRAELGARGRRVALERYVWSTERFVREALFPERVG